MNRLGLFLVATIGLCAFGCSKKKENKKTATKSTAQALKGKAKKVAAQKRKPEVRTLKTHCPPRLSLYLDLVKEYEAAAKAKVAGDAKPLEAFGAKIKEVEKLTVGFQRSTLNTYCRGFFNPAVQQFSAATALLDGKKTEAPAQATDTAKGVTPKPGAVVDAKTMKAANAALQAAACKSACEPLTDADKKTKCLAACPK